MMQPSANPYGSQPSVWVYFLQNKRRHFIKAVLASKYEVDMKYYTIYRWYIQSRYWIKDKYKYLIWDYLNDYETEDTLIAEYNEYVAKRGDVSA